MPSEVLQELNIHPGDDIQVTLRTVDETLRVEDADQAALQAGFERFFNHLDTLAFEKPAGLRVADAAGEAFAQVMDHKFRRLGFKE